MALAATLAIGVFAAETVIYENDFSDPATLNDFEQYRMEWEIKDGGLYLTENFIDGTEGASLDTSFSHIIYQTDEELTDYIIEADYMNIQTAGGIIFRANQDSVSTQQDGFFGYVAFIANNANAGALGCGGSDGKWKGNIKVGSTGACNISNNVHIKVTVKGEKIHTLITNIDSGKTVLDYTYTIGSSESDQIWQKGTFGLRMRAGLKANNAYSANNAYFDNLKVTTANEVDLGQTGQIATPTVPMGKIAIDTSNLIPVYTNNFDSFSSLADFEQFRGTWAVFDGKLYLSAATGTQSYILYAGDEELTTLTDYVVDVDMYNTQTQGGVILRSDLPNITGDTDDGIMGYMGFISNDGKLGALGAGQADGKWLSGNIEVSKSSVITPGSNIHLQFAVKGNMLQLVITDIASGKVLWQHSETNNLWSKGTFGFRLRGKATNAGLSNLNNTAFDNLVVSKFDESAPSVPVTPVVPDTPTTPSTPVTPSAPSGDIIYENDFSNPATLGDFKQYRMEWEIKNGGLYLTDRFFDGTEGASVDTSFAHIIYQAKETLTDYVVEVDYMNIQTAGGIIFRSQQDSVNAQQNGFFGYVAFIANNANCGALGCSDNESKWKGNIKVGTTGDCNISSNVHIKVTVKGDKIHTLITNIDTGKTVLDYTYTIGTNAEADQNWANGTFGLRMRAGVKANNAYSANNAYFDNLRVTTVGEDIVGGDTTETPETPVGTIAIDTSNLIPVYENKFETASDIADFEQFRGTWAVFNGQLYLSAATGTQSYILYAGDEDLTNLTDYVVDVDMYNTQTQGGVILRSDLPNITGDTDDGIMGYMGFISNDGTLGALGAGQADGKWLSGNIEVSKSSVITPGSNIHLQFAVKGNMLQLVITDIASGKVLWQHSETNDLWTKGTFGFRLRGKATNAGLNNINITSFDNLVISTYGEPKTVIKMTIGSKVGYVNNAEKELDVAPIIRGSSTMLPVRFVAENLGATVGWDGKTSTAILKTDDVEIKITIGADTATVNGTSVKLAAPAFIEGGRTYLPVRFVAENLGATVGWDGKTSTVTLTK